MKDGFQVYDSDTHINPAAEVLDKYVDPEFRPRLAELAAYRSPVGNAVEGPSDLHNYRTGTKYYRRILGEEGFLSVVIVIDSTTGKMIAGPEIHARGAGIDDAAFDEVRPRLEEALARAAADGINDVYQLTQLVRRTAGRWVNANYRRRPMIIPVLIEV